MDFWAVACGVDLEGGSSPGFGGDTYIGDEEWLGYTMNHLHGHDVYKVRSDQVAHAFESVVARLKQVKDSDSIRPYVKNALDRWDQSSGMRGLLRAIEESHHSVLLAKDVELYVYHCFTRQSLAEQWHRAKWYWATILFEWVFLSGLAAVLICPVIHGGGYLRWATHISIIPILFMMPVYLGYATFTFTSAGPSGGVLYPFLADWFRGGTTTALDRQIVAYLPQVLEPLSAPIGAPIVLSGMGMPGPTMTVIIGLFAGVAAVVIRGGYVHRARLHRLVCSRRRGA